MARNQVEMAERPRGLVGGQIGPASLTERLEHERDQLQSRLDQIDDILSGLKGNPETQKLLDAITKLGHFNY